MWGIRPKYEARVTNLGSGGLSQGENDGSPMKRTLFILVLGAVLGATGWHFYQRTFHPAMAQRTGDLAERTRESAVETKDQAVSAAKTVGEQLGDAGIIALIKGKYVMDNDLSALAIGVRCIQGHVTLTGSAKSPELIARATEVARQTKGVTGVTSKLTVKN
jgi:osmotically-inducible protein OsmY